MKLTREFYIPKHATKVAHKAVNAVVYLTEGPKFYAMGFAGKAERPTFNYSFRTVERRAAYVAEWFAGQVALSVRRAERKAQKRAFVHSLKVGDVLRSSWGYDQTNIDYYEVVAVAGAMVDVRPIGAESIDTGWLQGKCVPAPGHYTGEAKRYRPTEGNAVKVRSHCRAYPMECREVAGARVYPASHWTAYH